MPYTIEYLGLKGTCNTPEEFIHLAEHLRRQEPKPAYATVADAVSHMSEQGKQLLGILLSAHAPVPVSLLKKQMGLSENQLPGHITGTKEKFRACGLKPDEVLVKHVNGGEARYSVGPDFADDIRAALEVEVKAGKH